MSKNHFHIHLAVALAAALFVTAVGSATRAGDAAMTHRSASGGQMTMTGPYGFDVVYRPKETRVYLFGMDHRPLSARAVQGQIVMKVRGNEKTYRYPLKYVPPPAGRTGRDYLAAAVDVSRIRDGDMTVTFELAGLPDARQPRVAFTQTFALSRLAVTVVSLDEADRAGITRQQVCPVSGGKLGAMGTPIKVLVGDQAVYLCCKGCLSKIQNTPEFYLQKVARGGSQPRAAASGSGMVVAAPTAADREAIARQRVCPVSGGKLGAMGTPVKVTVNGQTLFLCCKGCVGKVQANPGPYLAKAAELRSGR